MKKSLLLQHFNNNNNNDITSIRQLDRIWRKFLQSQATKNSHIYANEILERCKIMLNLTLQDQKVNPTNPSSWKTLNRCRGAVERVWFVKEKVDKRLLDNVYTSMLKLEVERKGLWNIEYLKEIQERKKTAILSTEKLYNTCIKQLIHSRVDLSSYKKELATFKKDEEQKWFWGGYEFSDPANQLFDGAVIERKLKLLALNDILKLHGSSGGKNNFLSDSSWKSILFFLSGLPSVTLGDLLDIKSKSPLGPKYQLDYRSLNSFLEAGVRSKDYKNAFLLLYVDHEISQQKALDFYANRQHSNDNNNAIPDARKIRSLYEKTCLCFKNSATTNDMNEAKSLLNRTELMYRNDCRIHRYSNLSDQTDPYRFYTKRLFFHFYKAYLGMGMREPACRLASAFMSKGYVCNKVELLDFVVSIRWLGEKYGFTVISELGPWLLNTQSPKHYRKNMHFVIQLLQTFSRFACFPTQHHDDRRNRWWVFSEELFEWVVDTNEIITESQWKTVHEEMVRIYLGVGEFEKANDIMKNKMIKHGLKVDTHCFNSLIFYYGQREHDKQQAINALGELQSNGCKPNTETLDFLVKALLGGKSVQLMGKDELYSCICDIVGNLVALCDTYDDLVPSEYAMRQVYDATQISDNCLEEGKRLQHFCALHGLHI